MRGEGLCVDDGLSVGVDEELKSDESIAFILAVGVNTIPAITG